MSFIRQLSKDDLTIIIGSISYLDNTYNGVTFQKIEKFLKLPKLILSDILRGLEFFKLIYQNGNKYFVDSEKVQLWEIYDKELDYLSFYKSDCAKRIHELKGVNVNVPEYKGNINTSLESENDLYDFGGITEDG